MFYNPLQVWKSEKTVQGIKNIFCLSSSNSKNYIHNILFKQNIKFRLVRLMYIGNMNEENKKKRNVCMFKVVEKGIPFGTHMIGISFK